MCPRHLINLCESVISVLLPKSACLLRGAVLEIERFFFALRFRTEAIVVRSEELSPFARCYRRFVFTIFVFWLRHVPTLLSLPDSLNRPKLKKCTISRFPLLFKSKVLRDE